MAITGYLKQNTAATIAFGPFLDSTDGVTAKTGLTVNQAAVRLSKNGGTFAQKNDSTSGTHMENGYYSTPINATDTNTTGILTVAATISTAIPVRLDYLVLRSDEFDALFSSTGAALRGILATGTAQAATSTTIQLAAAETFGDSTLVGATVAAYGSTQGYWQTRVITAYTGSTDTATVDTWSVTPTGTITYIVFAGAPASTAAPIPANVVQVAGQTANASGAVTFPNATLASTTNITAATGITLAAVTHTGATIPTVTTTGTATNVTTVNGLAANVITAASINAGAITNAKFAAGAIDATAVADNAITANKIASGALTAAKFAAGAFDAVWTVTTRSLTSFGTLTTDTATAVWGAVTRTLSSFGTLPADVRTEMDTNSTKLDVAVSTRLATAGYTVPPTAAAIRTEIDANSTQLAAIKGKTDSLTFTTAGQVDSRVASVANNAITASAIATDAIGSTQLAADAATEIANATITQAATTPIPADVKKMNGATVNGDGTSGNLWRGA